MFPSMLRRIFLAAVFGACLIFGIQAPNFIDQYEKRIDAHYLEVVENLRGFQDIANRFHGGDLMALIGKHASSADSTFKAEAEVIGRMHARMLRFGKERAALRTGFSRKALHVLVEGDREIIGETYAGYSSGLHLDRQALATGVIVAAVVFILLELLLGLACRVLGLGPIRNTRS